MFSLGLALIVIAYSSAFLKTSCYSNFLSLTTTSASLDKRQPSATYSSARRVAKEAIAANFVMPTSVRSGAMVRLSVASDAKATIARQGAKGTSVEWNVKALNVQ